MKFKICNYSYFIADFDGVFTDNHVYLNHLGEEFVKCSRSDGFGISMLKSANVLKITDLQIAILSLEKNKVVNARSKKMGIPCFTGIQNKYAFLEKTYFPSLNVDVGEGFTRLIYLGNDLNDLKVIERAGISFVPNDSHPLVLSKASNVLSRNGGHGFVREAVEKIIGVKNILTVLDHLEGN